MFRKLLVLSALALPGATHSSEFSEANSLNSVLEEIIVSGYRSTSPLALDASLTLLDQETIQLSTVEHFEELVQMVPNMNLSGEGSRARYFQLRGIGEREQYEGAPNPSVGFIIDDIDLSGIGGVVSLYDVQQIEVLRGPQSARYGSSALAGIIYMRSKPPADQTSMNVELTAGNDGLFSIGAAVGGKLSNRSSGRLSLHHFESNGFRDNGYLGRDDTNGRDELTARGKLQWSFADDWNALLTGLYMDFDNGYDAWTVRNDDITHSDKPGRDSQETRAGSLRVRGPLNDRIDLVSITGLVDSDIFFSYDGDWGNDDFWQQYGDYVYDYEYINPRERSSLNQEFRLLSSPEGRLFNDSTDWVMGVFVQRLKEDNRISSTGIYDDSGEENYCPPCLTDRQISSEYKADTLAFFGSLDTRFGEKMGLSIGLRYEHWDASYDDDWRDFNYPDNPAGGNSCAQFDCEPSENMWGGHLAISHDWQENLRSYARIARGFKAGGFNPSLAALQGVALLGPEFIPYQPEYLWNYELGLKGIWLEGSLSGDLALFYMDRTDAQLSQSSQQVPFDPNSFVFVTYNGDARVYGLEASGSWQINETWQLHGSLGLLNTKIRGSEKTVAVSPNAVNRDLAHAPPYTLNFGVTYTAPGGWFARLDFNAIGAYYFDISHNQQSDAYQLVNLRVGKQWGAWGLSAWARNLFDEDYATRGFYFGNEPPLFENTLYTRFGDPRTYGITLSYDYGKK
jgi:outer membrane receptor protein involved in Fe transport